MLIVLQKGKSVFDTDENSIFYFIGATLEKRFNGASTFIQDSDEKTKVDVESTFDLIFVHITTYYNSRS